MHGVKLVCRREARLTYLANVFFFSLLRMQRMAGFCSGSSSSWCGCSDWGIVDGLASFCCITLRFDLIGWVVDCCGMRLRK